MLGVQSFTENKNLSAAALRLDGCRSWPTVKDLVLLDHPGAFHRLPSTLLLFLLRTLFSFSCLFVAGIEVGSSMDSFITTGTLSYTSLSIFCTFAGANVGAKEYKLVEKSAEIFTFALLTDTFGAVSVAFHVFPRALIS